MAKVVRFTRTGGPEVLQLEDVALGEPGAGQARVHHKAVGVNFIDTYHRTGLYPKPLPSGLGVEAAGVVEAIGPGVSNVAVGDRVAYVGGSGEAYADASIVPAAGLVKLPDDVPEEVAAGAMLKGLTVHMLLKRAAKPRAGDTILFHAAAGGVGLIACQWAKHLGLTLIGTAGTPAKAELARAHGAAHTILYRDEDFVARTREITNGRGVPVVYDSVGRDTTMRSLDCLSPRGLLVSFGNASGPPPPLELATLGQKGSLYVTRVTLFSYIADPAELASAAAELFEVIRSGVVEIVVGQRYALSDVALAHRDLESRATTGSTILVP